MRFNFEVMYRWGSVLIVAACESGGSHAAIKPGAVDTPAAWRIDTTAIVTEIADARRVELSASIGYVGALDSGDYFVVDYGAGHILRVSKAGTDVQVFGSTREWAG